MSKFEVNYTMPNGLGGTMKMIVDAANETIAKRLVEQMTGGKTSFAFRKY